MEIFFTRHSPSKIFLTFMGAVVRGHTYRGTAIFFLGTDGWEPEQSNIHSAATNHASPSVQKKILELLGERVSAWADGEGQG